MQHLLTKFIFRQNKSGDKSPSSRKHIMIGHVYRFFQI